MLILPDIKVKFRNIQRSHSTVLGPESLTYLRTLFCAYAKKWPSFVITKLFKMPK